MSANASDLSTRVEAVSVAEFPTGFIEKINREITKKNLQFNSSQAIFSLSAVSSLFELIDSNLVPALSASVAGLFEYDGAGNLVPILGSETDTYFELNSNNIQPI